MSDEKPLRTWYRNERDTSWYYCDDVPFGDYIPRLYIATIGANGRCSIWNGEKMRFDNVEDIERLSLEEKKAVLPVLARMGKAYV